MIDQACRFKMVVLPNPLPGLCKMPFLGPELRPEIRALTGPFLRGKFFVAVGQVRGYHRLG